MDKKALSERDICTKFITPAVKQAGWDEMSQIREEVSFTKGRIIVRGKLVTRGKAKRADYILYYKPNIPIALIEAKDNNHSVGDGMQQGLDYAATLNIPFVFSSNGDGFVFHDRTGTERRDGSQPRPRRLPVARRSLGALSRLEGPDAGRRADRSSGLFRRRQRQGPALLPGATPSTPRSRPSPRGRTASCSSWRPAPARPTPPSRSSGGCGRPGRKKRILFLADRNVLIDQTMVNDFRPFGAAMAKLSTGAKTIERHDGTDDRTDHCPRQEAPHRHRLRDLSRPLSGDHRPGGAAEALPRVLARLLRPDRHRRVPPRQRRRGFRLARNPRLLLRRHADRPHRHAEGDRVRLQHPLLRRAGLHLLAEAGHPATASSRPTR